MEAVLEGEMSIYDCEDYEAVLDEIGYEEFDQNGYIINRRYDPIMYQHVTEGNNVYKNNYQNNGEEEEKVDDLANFKLFTKCCLLVFIIYIISVVLRSYG